MIPEPARILNGLRKLAAGLKPFNESVWPGARNDLFVAHESIYHFFVQFCRGRRVLDAGCGTGYGVAILANTGASAILGLDYEPSSVRYARRHFQSPNARFEVADLDALVLRESFELIVSSNVLEHLGSPDPFLDVSWKHLSPGGRMLVAVPPITNEFLAQQHSEIHYHRSNRTVDEWFEALRRFDSQARVYRHIHKASVPTPDFSSQRTSKLSASDFEFLPADRDALHDLPTITAVFEAHTRRPLQDLG